ncbi:hypothetical protein ZHAS_00014935 [Anopheles sinensis]|uniref:Uncharacterized protein n=1 Tax=Anopheles sinensis TaxID=74873 RepID=A0A084W9N0_ANOSI|nr:hypothetical protein ZHAS_00014935 [Anopheles sinensis]
MAEDGKSDDGQNGSEQVELMETEDRAGGAEDIGKTDEALAATGNNDEEADAQGGEDSGKEEESKESHKKDKSGARGGGNRRGRSTRGLYGSRY